ncbi:MAG TPA: hypothetical protein VK155_18710 [Bacteroidales bacterium]|jgi:hypothetical protein|nr:hypothetical protein [Bacteroidales bacterium]
MKKSLVLIFLLITSIAAQAQKVDSIKAEQNGDFIKIRYKILESRPGELYKVKVLCSINGGLNTELRSVSGDVGEMVSGGKPEYMVLWDVLKDVDEVNSVDFIIRAELMQAIKPPKEKGYIVNLAPAVQLPGPGIGGRFGIMGKFGVSLQFIAWKAVLSDASYNGDTKFRRISLALSSRIINEKKSQVHLLTGFTIGNSLIKETYTNGTATTSHFKKAMTPGPEFGFAVSSGRLIFTLMGTKLLTGMTEEGQASTKNTFVSASLGVRF